MAETGIVRFPGNLDPRAQEFRPRNSSNHHQMTLYPPPPPPPPPPQIYFPYNPYPQFTAPPAYVSFVSSSGEQPRGPPSPPQLPQSALPSRTLLLTSVPPEVTESSVRRELGVFGDVRAVQMERLYDGILTVHFYDLRHAQLALTEIREQHMQQQSRLRKHYNALLTRNSGCEVDYFATAQLPQPARGLIGGCAVWAQFLTPATSGAPDAHNQGSLVVFNLDAEISTSRLRKIFEEFGPVKELRETPSKPHQKFVEFYDIRDAARALREMNGKEIHGKHVVIEFSRPGGHGRRHFNPATNTPTNNNLVVYSPRTSRYPPPQRPPPPPPPALPRKPFGRSSSNVTPRSHLCQTQQSTNKLSCSSSKAKNNKNTKLLEASMASLTLQNERRQQQHQSRSRSTKGRHKKFDSRFLIHEDSVISESNCSDSRTTVMIKNIPNKYSQKLLLNMLDNHCIHCNEQIADSDDQPLSSYDFLYLPIDFINKCNVGYGFVNMTSPEATLRLYKAFHLQSWEVFNSRKICHVTYARVQGLEALKDHFKNSKFPSATEEILPVVFSPPRDGRQLTEPLALFGHTTTPSSHSKADDDEMDGQDRLENGEELCGDDVVCGSSSSCCSSSSPNGGDNV